MTPRHLLVAALAAACAACAVAPPAAEQKELLRQAERSLDRKDYGKALAFYARVAAEPAEPRLRYKLQRLRALAAALPSGTRLDAELLRPELSAGLAARAVAAYLGGEDRRAALLAAAAAGADPGAPFARELSAALEKAAGIKPAGDERLRPELLVLHLLDRAQEDYAAGRTARALAACEEALWIEPESPAVHERLGSIYFALERPARAREHWGRALALDPANAELREFLARLEAAEK